MLYWLKQDYLRSTGAETVATSAYLRNRTVTRALKEKMRMVWSKT